MLAVDAISTGVSYGTSEICQAMGCPGGLTLVLSLLAGMGTSAGLGSKVFGNGETGRKIIQKVDELTNDQIEALVKYSGFDYRNINNSLRGLDILTSDNQLTVKTIESVLDNASLPKDMILYRGTSTDALGPLKNLSPDELVGKTIVEPGFMSTSTEKIIAEGTFVGNMQMTIKASKGSQGLDISSISQYASEAEVLFQAGQIMEIQSAEIMNGVLHLGAEIIE